MYVIAVYDVGQKRVGKMLKLSRRYLNWIQNSVFEGSLTAVQIKQYIWEARQIMDVETDSLILFSSRNEKWLEKQVIGIDKNKIEQIL